MNHIENLKNQAQKLKDRLTKSPLEQTLSEATSNENWNTPTKLLQEIADATYGYTSCDVIIKFIWKRLDSDNKEWRRILKTLGMIEYLTKNGAPRCVGEFRDAIFKIRSFSDFFLVEGGSDKGAAIRDKTKQLVDLLTNEKQIEEERENSKKIRDRLAAAGGATAIGSGTGNYQGYSADTYKNDKYTGYSGESQTKPTFTNTTAPEKSRNYENEYTNKYGVYDGTNGIDKYKTKAVDPATPDKQKTQNNTSDYKQPFQEPPKKLSKPGEIVWDVPAPKQSHQTSQATHQQIQQPQVKQQPASVSLIDFDEPKTIQQVQPIQQVKSQEFGWGNFETPVVQPQQVQQSLPFAPQFIPAPIQQPVQQPITQLPLNLFNTQQQQPATQVIQPQTNNFQSLYQAQLHQPSPNLYAAFQPSPQVSHQAVYQQQQQTNLNPQFMQPAQQLGKTYQDFPNTQQSHYQQPIPQYQVQQPKKADDDFLDFQAPQQTIKPQPAVNNLLEFCDLTKEKQTIQNNKPQAAFIPQTNLLASQAEIDGFHMNYNKPNYGSFQPQAYR